MNVGKTINKKIAVIVLAFVLAVFLAASTIVFGLAKSSKTTSSTDKKYFVLVVKDSQVRPQFISLISYSYTDELSAIFIPENTRVEIPGIGINRIYHAYKYGGRKKLMETLKKLTHINDLGYLEIDKKQAIELIDWAGGVEIKTKKGDQLLSGKEIEKYFNEINSDRKRSKKIHIEFYKNLLKGYVIALSKKAESRSPSWSYWKNEINTDLKITQLKELFNRLVGLRDGDISVIVLPGRLSINNDIFYWVPNASRFKYIFSDFKDLFSLSDWENYDGEQKKQKKKQSKKKDQKRVVKTDSVSTAVTTSASISTTAPSASTMTQPASNTAQTKKVSTGGGSTGNPPGNTGNPVKNDNSLSFDISILDGGSDPKAIVDVGKKLESYGIKIFSTTVLKKQYKNSFIIYRQGHEREAKLVSEILEMKNMMVRTADFEDISIVMIMLGQDTKK